MPDLRTCRALNQRGWPCGAPPLVEGGRCFWHDPETQEAAAEARRLGGRRRKREGGIKGALDLKGVRTGADLLRVLEVALMDTLEMENSIPRTRALTHVVSVAARVKETTEFDARLDAITAGMTVPQRVAAMLTALLEAEPDGQPVAVSIGQDLPSAGWAAFRRTSNRVVQLRATTYECLVRVEVLVTCLYLVAGWHATLGLSATLADQLEAALDRRYGGRQPRGQGNQELEREVRAVADGLWGIVVAEEVAREGARPVSTLEAVLRDRILAAHHLLRALAIEAGAFAAELGVDLLGPDLQATADRRRADLTACIETIDLDPPVVLTEPSDAYIAAIAARCRPEEGEDTVSW